VTVKFLGCVASTAGSHGEPLSKVALLLLAFVLVPNRSLKAMQLVHHCHGFKGCTREREFDSVYRKHG